jgi:hypothetical protein
MNKLYKAGLAVLAIALLTSSALAYSPSWDTIPDVIVGGGDFAYTQAFNWQDYVSDQDTSPVSLLQVVFAEGNWDTGESDRSLQTVDGSTSNEVGINSQTEVDYTGLGDTIVSAPITIDGSTTLNGDGGWLTFMTTQLTSDRAVVLIASDGATTPVASSAFRVRELISEPDQLTSEVTITPLDSWDTDGDWSADWVFLGGAGMTSVASGGSIGTVSSLANTGSFSTWQLSNSATKIPITVGQILRGRWTVNGGTATPVQWPAMRYGFFEQSNGEFEYLVIDSTVSPPAANASKTFQTFIEPSANLPSSNMNVLFVLIDVANNRGGTFSVESLDVDGITVLDSLFTQDYLLDAGGDDDFTSVVALAGAGVTSSQNADSFTWTVNSTTTLSAPIGQRNTGLIMAANTLYRVKSTVSSTVAAATQPKFSLRAFAADNSLISVHLDQATSSGSGHLTDSGGKDYSVFLSSEGADGQELRISFDVINDNNALSGPVTWERAVIESVPLSIIP